MKYIKEYNTSDIVEELELKKLVKELNDSYEITHLDYDDYDDSESIQIDMDQRLIDKVSNRYPKCKITIAGENSKSKKKYFSIDYRFKVYKIIISLQDDYYQNFSDSITFDQQSELFKYLDKMYKIFFK